MDDKPILITDTDVDHDAAARVARHFQDAIERASEVRGNKPNPQLLVVGAGGRDPRVEALREGLRREREAALQPHTVLVSPAQHAQLVELLGAERVEDIGRQYNLAVDNYPPPSTASTDQGPYAAPPAVVRLQSRSYGKRLAARQALMRGRDPVTGDPIESRNQRKRRRRKARP